MFVVLEHHRDALVAASQSGSGPEDVGFRRGLEFGLVALDRVRRALLGETDSGELGLGTASARELGRFGG